MKSLVHPLWASPPGDATDLQKQAHRLMLQTLLRVEKSVEGVLAFPEEVGGKRVLEAAMSASLNPRIAPELRTAALTMLQQRMAKVDPDTPQRVFMLDQDYQNPISTKAGDDLESLRQFEDAFHQYLIEEHATRTRNTTQSTAEDALLALGVLETLLVTRLGYCSIPLLGHVAASVAASPWIAAPWAWVDVKFTYARDPMQLRRIFLDPVALAAWIAASGLAHRLPKPDLHAKSAKRRAFQTGLANRSFVMLAKCMKATGNPSTIQSLARLCASKEQYLRVSTMPLLATFARGDIVSSSLDAGTWLRLIGCERQEGINASATADEPVAKEVTTGKGPLQPLPNLPAGAGQESLAEQALQGDLDEDGIIAQLRDIMRGERRSWKAGFDALTKKLIRDPEKNETARCVVSWLYHLAFERTGKGSVLRDGSIRNYRGLLANRLLLHLPPRLRGMDEEELQDAYLEVFESQSSEAQGGRINVALVSFHQYVRIKLIPELPQVRISGYSHGGYAISSRIISEAEFQRGLQLIQQDRLGRTTDRLRRQTEAFWILAFRLGMRRREILGLQVRDVGAFLVRVRKNKARSLKTANARRVLPLCVLSKDEREVVLGLAGGRDEGDFMFFGRKPPSARELDSHRAVATINELLKRLTGDSKLHPHNLRHSTATCFLFGSLGSDLGLVSHPYLVPWMKDCFAPAVAMEEAISGELHRKGGRGSALAMTMGHGSEITTYQHYVHCLDLLLFLACTSGTPAAQRSGPGLRKIHRDRAVIAALLGCSPTEIRCRHPAGFVGWIARQRPHQVTPLARKVQAAVGDSSAEQAWPVSLEALLEVEAADATGAKPERRSEIDAVAAVLDQFNRVAPDHRGPLRSILHRWKEAQMKNSDWASMKGDAAKSWIKDLRNLGSPIAIQAIRVTRSDGKDRKEKTKVARPLDPKSYRAKRGVFWLRFSEATSKLNQRGRKTKQSRSRAQASITWVIAAVLETTKGQALFGF